MDNKEEKRWLIFLLLDQGQVLYMITYFLQKKRGAAKPKAKQNRFKKVQVKLGFM